MTTATAKKNPTKREGGASYDNWRRKLLAYPATRSLYEQEAAKKELWLQLVEARLDAGLTQAQLGRRLGVSQAQVARIEKRGYDSYTLKTLRRYVEALGGGLSVVVQMRPPAPARAARATAAPSRSGRPAPARRARR